LVRKDQAGEVPERSRCPEGRLPRSREVENQIKKEKVR
jgi:hypothetical protein